MVCAGRHRGDIRPGGVPGGGDQRGPLLRPVAGSVRGQQRQSWGGTAVAKIPDAHGDCHRSGPVRLAGRDHGRAPGGPPVGVDHGSHSRPLVEAPAYPDAAAPVPSGAGGWSGGGLLGRRISLVCTGAVSPHQMVGRLLLERAGPPGAGWCFGPVPHPARPVGGCFLVRLLPLCGIGRPGGPVSAAHGQSAPPPHTRIDLLVQSPLVGGTAGSGLVGPGQFLRRTAHPPVGAPAGMDGLQLGTGPLCRMADAKEDFK